MRRRHWTRSGLSERTLLPVGSWPDNPQRICAQRVKADPHRQRRSLVMISASEALTGSYDYSEVARSVLIAIAASYAALDLAGRVTAASARIRLAWLSGGAAAMGIGIWSMHMKGMLAFRLPVPVEYHWPTILAALLVAILASAVALFVVSRRKMGWVAASIGSV